MRFASERLNPMQWMMVEARNRPKTLKPIKSGEGIERMMNDRPSVGVPERYRRLMDELSGGLSAQLGIDLKAETLVDKRGLLRGRVFIENSLSNVQFSILRVSHPALESMEHGHYEVEVRTEMLPGVNDLSKYFPFTRSNRIVKEVMKSARGAIARHEGVPTQVDIDKEIARNVSYLVGAQALAGGFLGGLLGFLWADSMFVALQDAIVGGAIGAGAILFLAFRLFD